MAEEKKSDDQTIKRGPYVIIKPDQKLTLAKHAYKEGVRATLARYSDMGLKYNTVSYWRNKYKNAILSLEEGEEPTAEQCGFIVIKKEPLMGRELDQELRVSVANIRTAGGAINKTVLSALITGILATKAPWKLTINGGRIDPSSRSLHQSIYQRYNLVKRRATSSRKQMTESEKNRKKEAFTGQVMEKIIMDNIDERLVINFDETSLPGLPANDYTMNIRGGLSVKIAGKGDKRNITGLIGGCLDGTLLPPQLIYKGTTKRCEPAPTLFPANWNITHSKNHWSTNNTKNEFLDEIIMPYVEEVRDDIGHEHAPVLAIYDYHTTNVSNPVFYNKFNNKNIQWVLVPAGMTDELQPMDQVVNKKIKKVMREELDVWYGQRVIDWVDNGNDVKNFKMDFRWSLMKPIHATWVVNTMNLISSNDVRSSFKMCGIGLDSDDDDSSDNLIQSDEE